MVLKNFAVEKLFVRENALVKVSYNHILNLKMWLKLQHFENEGAFKMQIMSFSQSRRAGTPRE